MAAVQETGVATSAPPVETGAATRPQLWAWSLVSIVGTMMMIPINAVVPAFYAKSTLVSLADIGFVFLIARLYDAVVDPTVGYLSDRTRSRLGRRKPWILAGGLLAAVAELLLFNPAPGATIAYLLPVTFAFYTAYSMLVVPLQAWGSELARGYAERSLISGLLNLSGVIGLLIFMGLPILLSSPWLRVFKTAEFTPSTLHLLSLMLLVAIPVCVLIPVLVAPRGVAGANRTQPKPSDIWRSMRLNRPFWWFCGGYLLSSLGYGVYYATTYLFIDAYLGMSAQFAAIYALAAISQVLTIPFWTRLCQTHERHHIWALGIAAYGALLPLRLFIHPGPLAFPLLAAITFVGSIANAASQVPQMAMLADCIDYATVRTGQNLAGSYYAIQSFTLKACLAAGGSLAFFALSWFSYDAKAQVHTPASLAGLAAVHTAGPLLLYVAAGAVLWFFPISRARQAEIRRDLEAGAAPAHA